MKTILSTTRQPITALYVVRTVSRELRIPARLQSMMIASERVLHEVVTDTTIAIMLDQSETTLSIVEISDCEIPLEQLQTEQATDQATQAAAFSTDAVQADTLNIVATQISQLSDSTRETP